MEGNALWLRVFMVKIPYLINMTCAACIYHSTTVVSIRLMVLLMVEYSVARYAFLHRQRFLNACVYILPFLPPALLFFRVGFSFGAFLLGIRHCNQHHIYNASYRAA